MNVIPRFTPGGASRVGRALAAGASALALCGMLASAAPASAAPRSAAPQFAGLRAACPAVPSGQMRCFVLYRPQYAVNRAIAEGHKTSPVGWGPKTLERAYRLPVNLGSHQTIAVSIAFHTPHLANYLKIYREHYGLPPCTTGSGCLRIVNQQGKASPTAPSGLDSGWDLEATLDVSMISAACPHCKILVVEANSNDDADLARTDDTAARLGAAVMSNSYGQRENGLSMAYRKDYRHPGHMVVASSGDLGFDAANFPANLGSVTAVGGTSLASAHNKRGFTERVWNDPNLFGAGSSGCSAYVGKPSWQHDTHCPGRTVADISAIAANIPIFNTAWGGWLTVAGTSVSSPFIAGVYGLAGNAAAVTPRHLYQHAADFFDITKGNNALFGTAKQVCGADYLCEAKKGYDAPTGLGSPDGIAGL
jgi:subtilase family serine protease